MECKTCLELQEIAEGRIEHVDDIKVTRMASEKLLEKLMTDPFERKTKFASLYRCRACSAIWVLAISDQAFPGFLIDVTDSLSSGSRVVWGNMQFNDQAIKIAKCIADRHTRDTGGSDSADS